MERRPERKGTFVFTIACVLFGLLLATGCNGPDGSDPETRTPRPTVHQGPGSGAKLTGRRFLVQVEWGLEGGRLVAPGDTLKGALPDAPMEQIRNDLYAVDVPESQDVEEALEKIRKTGRVVHIEENIQVHTFHRPNDPQYSQQYAHQLIQSESAWDITQGSHDVVVAIIDTGIDYNHPDLADNMWKNPDEIPGNGRDDDGNGLIDDVYGWDFANNDSQPMADDSHTHGTHCAGIVGAIGDNNTGVVGASPRVKFMALKFLRSDGYGDVGHAIQAIDYAISKHVQVMSNSWGSSQGSYQLEQAVARAEQAGIVFVAAAGNGGQDGVGDDNDRMPTYPASINRSNVIAVAATDSSDQLASFSNYGRSSVHVGAPGVNILSTLNNGRTGYMSGTSMATPLVSGVAALMLALKPELKPAQLRQVLMDNVDPVPALNGRTISNGRINVFKALRALTDGPIPEPTPTPTPTPTPSPTPTPPPVGGVAPSPLVGGSPWLVANNPNVQIPIDYDVSSFPGAAGVYFEVARPNTNFSNPNEVLPDPYRLIFTTSAGVRNRLWILPARHLPGWGVYQMRIIPLNSQSQPVGRFSNSAVLELRPF